MKEFIDLLIIALENAIPEKVIKKKKVNYEDIKNVLVAKCPSCKWNVACFERYCSNCGQKLDWE